MCTENLFFSHRAKLEAHVNIQNYDNFVKQVCKNGKKLGMSNKCVEVFGFSQQIKDCE